jgi:hypothetical protein
MLRLIARRWEEEGRGADDKVGAAARALGYHPELTERQAFDALTAAADRTAVIAELLAGPKIPLSLVREALGQYPRLAVRRAAIKRADALADPEIRAVLAESDCADVRSALISTAEPEEATAHLARLSETNLDRALSAIENHLAEGVEIPIEVAGKLLADDRERVRMRTIRALGARRVAASAPDSEGLRRSEANPPSRSSARRR